MGDLAPYVSILYYNASILLKIDLLQAKPVTASYPSVICIVESWLSEEIADDEVSIDDYQLIRLDRNRHGGGALLYIFNLGALD